MDRMDRIPAVALIVSILSIVSSAMEVKKTKERLYMVFFMMEGLETDHLKIFANSAQDAADKIKARTGVECVIGVYLPVTDWR